MLKEPLLHFVLLGPLFFALDAFLRERTTEAGGGDIVVTEGRIENIAALYTKTWQRLPTPEELRGLVNAHVLEEALYREGLAAGLDRNDTIIRRRIRQKMDFVVQDFVELAEPTDAELEDWLARHAASYARPARFDFRQVFLDPERHGDEVSTEAERVLAELRAPGGSVDPRDLGDRSLLEHAYGDAGADRVAGSFGRAFAERLGELPTGDWVGPVESAFGLHLVLVDARTEGRAPSLAEVRDAVARDWSFARREEASQAFYDEVLSRYRVTIEWPEVGPTAESDGAED